MPEDGFFQTKNGKAVAAVIVLLCVVGSGYMVYAFWRGNPALAHANDRVFICSETMKSFTVSLDQLTGTTVPIHSPYSGKDTGYPAELCYWTSDGKPKADPTPVLLNGSVGKPGPTFCPDCGRLVVPHNPAAREGVRPPPTRSEWAQRHGSAPH